MNASVLAETAETGAGAGARAGAGVGAVLLILLFNAAFVILFKLTTAEILKSVKMPLLLKNVNCF